MKNSLLHGIITSETEISNISNHGIWLLTGNKELFLSYDEFPWFKDQTISSIINVQKQSHDHFYWPDIDVDLTLDAIEHPEKYPLKAKIK